MLSDSILSFDGYTVKKLYYEPTEFNNTENLQYKPEFSNRVEGKKNGEIEVELGVRINENKEPSFPFSLAVSLVGRFRLDTKSDDTEFLKTIATKNTVSILFPYLRAIVTQLTSAANVPPLILPIVNLADNLHSTPQVDE